MDYLNRKLEEVKHYKKFAKVKAHQSKGGEQIQTQLDGRNETEIRVTKLGDWVVSNIESQGEKQIVDDKTFQKRYDVSNPNGDTYSPKGANFYGVVYDGSLGENITFSPPNWGGSTMSITKGYMIGGPDPKNFGADFYGIDPSAFEKTYKPAEMVKDGPEDSPKKHSLGEDLSDVIDYVQNCEAEEAPTEDSEFKKILETNFKERLTPLSEVTVKDLLAPLDSPQ